MKKLFVIGLIVAAIAAAAIGFYLKNKKVSGLESAKPDFMLKATELFEAFEADEKAALEKYNGKVILVEGIVQDVQPVNDSTGIVLLVADDSGLGTIKCGMNRNHVAAIQKFNADESVKLKCICSGVSKIEEFGFEILDIELSRCVVVN